MQTFISQFLNLVGQFDPPTFLFQTLSKPLFTWSFLFFFGKTPKELNGMFGSNSKKTKAKSDSYNEFDESSDEPTFGDYFASEGDDSAGQSGKNPVPPKKNEKKNSAPPKKQDPSKADSLKEVRVGEPMDYYVDENEDESWKSWMSETQLGQGEGWDDFEIEILDSDQVGEATTYVEVLDNNDALIQGKNIRTIFQVLSLTKINAGFLKLRQNFCKALHGEINSLQNYQKSFEKIFGILFNCIYLYFERIF